MAKADRNSIPSPPSGFVPDDMTQGPALPDDWDGDAWKLESKSGNEFAQRAWNKTTGRFAIARASTYAAASQQLLDDVNKGGSGKAEVKVTEEIRRR
jgi:hypothetical protein